MNEKREVRTLCGGFAADMTVVEHNAWVAFCIDSDELRDLHRAKARLITATANELSTLDDVTRYADAEMAAQAVMHRVGRDWCAENIKTEEQREEEEAEEQESLFREWKSAFADWKSRAEPETDYLRPEVRAFARAMEDGLRRHDEERGQGWKVTTVGTLMNHAVGQFSRLRHDVKQAGNATGACLAQSVLKRAAAAANLIMMVADVGGGLKTEEGDDR